MTKSFRQGRILELIRTSEVHTQQEIQAHLKSLGVEATQVTVSRDIHELGLVKTADGYRPLDENAAVRTLGVLAREFVTSAMAARNLVVLRTKPGNAMSVAKALDEEDWSEIVGTIGGDDTVLIITTDDATAGEVAGKLMHLRG